MHNDSLPPSDRPEAAEPATPTWDVALRDQFRALRNGTNADRRNYTQAQLAAKLGVSSSMVSQYLPSEDAIRDWQDEHDAGREVLPPVKYTGDLLKLEQAVRDLLAADALRQRGGVKTINCDLVERFRTAAEQVRRTNDAGAVFSPSGSGKTRAVDWYVANNPTVIRLTAREWKHDVHSVISMIFAAVAKGGYDHKTTKGDWIERQLSGSDRMILVDDAHKLTRPALQFLFDLHDSTQCPVLLVGTPDLVAKVDDDTQRASRLGYREELGAVESSAVVRHLIRQVAPASEKELVDVCNALADGDGHLRRVEKHLRLAARYKEALPAWTWARCWEAACAKLKTSTRN